MEPKVRMGATRRNLQAQPKILQKIIGTLNQAIRMKIFPICFLGSRGEFRLVAPIQIFGSFTLLRYEHSFLGKLSF
jgi:hypothetical protein